MNEVNNRLCPQEEILSEYLMGKLSRKERQTIEEHLSSCDNCRKLVVETYNILNKNNFIKIKKRIFSFVEKNIWILNSILFLMLSFIIHKYFFQFLVLALLTGSKWIIDKRSIKMMLIQKEIKKEEKSWK